MLPAARVWTRAAHMLQTDGAMVAWSSVKGVGSIRVRHGPATPGRSSVTVAGKPRGTGRWTVDVHQYSASKKYF